MKKLRDGLGAAMNVGYKRPIIATRAVGKERQHLSAYSDINKPESVLGNSGSDRCTRDGTCIKVALLAVLIS